MPSKSKSNLSKYLRNFIFGVEDSLVSTVGLLSGTAMAGLSRADIFAAGLILIFVEALSMGVGSFLSEDSADQLVSHNKKGTASSITASLIMFSSYFVSGFIPLTPYMLFDTQTAFITSIIFSLAALFLLGALSAAHFKVNLLRQGVKMLVLGGLAIVVGVFVGNLINQ